MTNTYIKTMRTSVEYNGMEFLTALMVKFNDFHDFDSLFEKLKSFYKEFDNYKEIIVFNSNPSITNSEMNEFQNYVNDIGKKKNIIDNYIKNFRKCFQTFEKFNYEHVQKVFISGKINHHPEITELNKDVSKIDAKADIYIQLVSGKIIGVSVKQNRNATKSNYSVQKMLGKDCDETLSKIRKEFLKENGFSNFNKEQRPLINELFYPQNINNPYWIALKNMIEENKNHIISQIIQPLCCSKLPYDMYEYNGETFYYINEKVDLSKVSFEEHHPYYLDSKGNKRKAAKLFYRLVIGDNTYRVEVRWKGNIHNSSPQFQLHEDLSLC